MSLADRCVHHFDSKIRIRGHEYFEEGRVLMRSGGASDLRALVHGESEYEVLLDWGFSREQLAVCCTCPYYDDHAICKHIWATILAADEAAIGPRGKGRLGLLPMDPEDYDADNDDGAWIDDYDDDFEDDNSVGPARAARPAAAVRPRRNLAVKHRRPSPSGSSNSPGPRPIRSRDFWSGRSRPLGPRRAKSGMCLTRT